MYVSYLLPAPVIVHSRLVWMSRFVPQLCTTHSLLPVPNSKYSGSISKHSLTQIHRLSSHFRALKTPYPGIPRLHHQNWAMREARYHPFARHSVRSSHRHFHSLWRTALYKWCPVLCKRSRHWTRSGHWHSDSLAESGGESFVDEGSVLHGSRFWLWGGTAGGFCEWRGGE
jgi:hypothetical protein